MAAIPNDIPLRDRLIFALDVDTPEEARSWVKLVEGQVGFYKIGLELFLAGGFDMVEWIAARGHKIFLDLKFFDVPRTVARAVRQLQGRGIEFTTVHGDSSIVKAAVDAAACAREGPKVLAVTVLTSLSDEDMLEFGFKGALDELVYKRAKSALSLGCDGVVASGLEAAMLRKRLGWNFLIVTPGIRPENSTRDDQRRVVTAKYAMANGADHIVIGRPIRDAKDPEKTVLMMQDDIQKGLASRVQRLIKQNLAGTETERQERDHA
ncbi:MAG: orotidine-5'-phosphate decarboxylase [Dissulfurimicrobium sp.]|uniref:orotidine-5'-phosphate decarboxylase n=1 Tax=Dissulfurimicrobium TaxID=1769732 RepID=UPI001EDBA3C7|nr:orotidine-5'-phosphate decarboxylase [Dissulfurimicrobium hydrothermale]UKL14414.1 orotidine-5'-phosphate decarboxylase [Dissulfurimicrobium hydrothermale]